MKKINNFIIVVLLVFSYMIALYNLKRKLMVRFLIAITILPVLFVPKIFRKLKIKIDDNLEFLYLIFIVFAYFLGTVLNFYERFPHYDTLMHFLSGVFEAFLAIMLFKKSDSKIYNILFILGFVALISSAWEIFEFTASKALNVDPQRVELTGVDDTMKDLIVAFIGGILVLFIDKGKAIKK